MTLYFSTLYEKGKAEWFSNGIHDSNAGTITWLTNLSCTLGLISGVSCINFGRKMLTVFLLFKPYSPTFMLEILRIGLLSNDIPVLFFYLSVPVAIAPSLLFKPNSPTFMLGILCIGLPSNDIPVLFAIKLVSIG